MRRFDAAILGTLIMAATAASAGGAPAPKEKPLPLTPVLGQNRGGWRFAKE
jgi:hypothetical protein